MVPLCPGGRFRPKRAGALLLVGVVDLALGELFEGHRQIVLRARLDERRKELVERALAKLVVVVVDLPGPLGRDDHDRVARARVARVAAEIFLTVHRDLPTVKLTVQFSAFYA